MESINRAINENPPTFLCPINLMAWDLPNGKGWPKFVIWNTTRWEKSYGGTKNATIFHEHKSFKNYLGAKNKLDIHYDQSFSKIFKFFKNFSRTKFQLPKLYESSCSPKFVRLKGINQMVWDTWYKLMWDWVKPPSMFG